MKKRSKEEFSAKEAKQRFEAALRGARVTGHKTMDEVTAKRPSRRKIGTATGKKRKTNAKR